MADRTDRIADFLSLFLSFRGRLDRRRYWFVLLAAFVVGNAAFIGVAILTGPAFQALLGFLFFYVFLTIWAKRLHDFDFSGLWILAWLFGSLAVEFLLEETKVLRSLGYRDIDNVFSLATLFGGSVLIGLIPGTPGPNRFDYNPSPEN